MDTARMPTARALQGSCFYFFLLLQQFYIIFVSLSFLNTYYFEFIIYYLITIKVT